MAPQLESWVAGKLQEEAAILKERRKGREERALASKRALRNMLAAQVAQLGAAAGVLARRIISQKLRAELGGAQATALE